jgi:hypothetical protein
MANGDIWITNQLTEIPAGTIAATFRVAPDTGLLKLGTVSGTSPSYACSGGISGSRHTAADAIAKR